MKTTNLIPMTTNELQNTNTKQNIGKIDNIKNDLVNVLDNENGKAEIDFVVIVLMLLICMVNNFSFLEINLYVIFGFIIYKLSTKKSLPNPKVRHTSPFFDSSTILNNLEIYENNFSLKGITRFKGNLKFKGTDISYKLPLENLNIIEISSGENAGLQKFNKRGFKSMLSVLTSKGQVVLTEHDWMSLLQIENVVSETDNFLAGLDRNPKFKTFLEKYKMKNIGGKIIQNGQKPYLRKNDIDPFWNDIETFWINETTIICFHNKGIYILEGEGNEFDNCYHSIRTKNIA